MENKKKSPLTVNLIVIAAVVVMATAVLLLSGAFKGKIVPNAGTLPADDASTVQEATEEAVVQAYLIISAGDTTYAPIALEDGKRYTLKQGEQVNVIETTASGMVMASSTCENQDCVLQGEVTLDNRGSRVLQNMILCLPNEVVLELLTPEEVAQRTAGGAQ